MYTYWSDQQTAQSAPSAISHEVLLQHTHTCLGLETDGCKPVLLAAGLGQQAGNSVMPAHVILQAYGWGVHCDPFAQHASISPALQVASGAEVQLPVNLRRTQHHHCERCTLAGSELHSWQSGIMLNSKLADVEHSFGQTPS